MKVRADFVTNSSSSSYLCYCIDTNDYDTVLRLNGIPNPETDIEAWNKWCYEESDGDFTLKGGLEFGISECNTITYIGYCLTEEDLETKTLKDIKIEILTEMCAAYGCNFGNNFHLEYGETYN